MHLFSCLFNFYLFLLFLSLPPINPIKAPAEANANPANDTSVFRLPVCGSVVLARLICFVVVAFLEVLAAEVVRVKLVEMFVASTFLDLFDLLICIAVLDDSVSLD